MKKTTFLICMFFFTLQYYAQLQNGSIAPDFTATDLNGESHTLSTYLNAGKTVIIEFSGTGCGPCWKYKKTEALQDLYNAFGPSGSNELMVLQIEDYLGSSYDYVYDKLHGITGTQSSGFGNWVEGTPFPIILSETLNLAYQIEYVPTIYMVCPNGKIQEIGQSLAIPAKNIINNQCGMLSGVQNYGKVLETSNGFCTSEGGFKAKFKNYGSNNITSAVFVLKEGNAVIATATYSGVLTQFNSATIQFEDIDIDLSENYSVEIQSINGVSNFNPEFSTANLPFSISAPSGIEIKVKIHTNDYPEKLLWNITSSSSIIASGGPYTDANDYAVIEHTITLSDDSDCYSLNLISNDGYGWRKWYWGTPETVTPGIEVFSGSNIVYSNLNVGNFGSVMLVENFLSTGLLSVDEINTENFAVYPNPTSGILQITGDEFFELNVFDTMGKQVFHSDAISSTNPIDLSGLSNGIYIAIFLDYNNNQIVHKIILDR